MTLLNFRKAQNVSLVTQCKRHLLPLSWCLVALSVASPPGPRLGIIVGASVTGGVAGW